MLSYFKKMKKIMDKLRVLNPNVNFGTFHMREFSLEWCGSVEGLSLKLPDGWSYSKSKGQILGPDFTFYYWKEYRY